MVYTDMIARIFIIAGSAAFFLSKFVNVGIRVSSTITKIFAVIVGMATLYLVSQRDFYLPFLGKCVFPAGDRQMTGSALLGEKTTVSLTGLPPKSRVVYWAAKRAEANRTFQNPMDAYDYGNAGQGVTDDRGEITFEIDCPGSYIVNKFGVFKKNIPKHVHYRYELEGYKGLFSGVNTKYIKC
jgi:hypothetical protein